MSEKSLRYFVVAFFAVAAVCSFSLQAVAERYYDHATGTWIRYKPEKYERNRKFHRQRVVIKTSEVPGSIIVDTDKKFLFYVVSKNRAIRYGVGVGRKGFGWHGSVTVRTKREWPSWTPPKRMRQRKKAEGIILPKTVKGGPLNPLGSRAIYLYRGNRDTLYRIHGTNKPWTIGRNVSAGCIRLTNEDVEHLYERVRIGTRVTVIGPNENSDKIYRPLKSPFLALFSRT